MNKKEVFAWGMYDLANTIFSALFVTFFYPFYVKQFLGGNELQIGLVFGLSMLAVGLIVPVIGAWSDHMGRRLPFMFFFTIVCCIFTWLVAAVPLGFALVCGFFANFAYHAALTTYNALLPTLAKKNEIGNVSGIGIGMGYIGTLISLAIAAPILMMLGWESAEGARAIFGATAIMFFAFSLVTFFVIKEPGNGQNWKSSGKYVLLSVRAVLKTLKNVYHHRQFFKFLMSQFWYANAINAVILFLFLFAKQQINLSVKAFFVVYTLQSVGAVIGSFVAGSVVDKYGPKKVLVIAGFAWMAVIVLLLFVKSAGMFVFAGMLGGAALGTVWTAQRPKLLSLVKEADIGQFFGFLELTNKFSGILGPIVFGFLAHKVSYPAALISLIVFFALGLLSLRGVPGDVK